jgi:hypothetical protein
VYLDTGKLGIPPRRLRQCEDIIKMEIKEICFGDVS